MNKRLISILLAAVMILLCIPVTAQTFSDVPASEWFYEAVSYCSQKGIFKGTGEGNFSPLRTISRSEFVTALANYDGADIEAEEFTGFTDVDTTSWYYHPMAWAKNNGIVSGTSETRFSPNDKISREQLCTMICRYLGYKGIVKEADYSTPFDDDASISDWAREAVYVARSLGIVKGVGKNMFNPKGTSTRAEAAQVMMNLDKFCENEKGNEFMLDDATVDIKIEGLTKSYKFLHISDSHLTLTDETDTSAAVADQAARGAAFDAQITDGVKKEDRLANAFKYAEAEGCDNILLTGDIIDAPSNGNISYLGKLVLESSVPSTFVLGNHDWTYAADYQSNAQRRENIPKFEEIFSGDTEESYWNEYVNYYEYEGFAVVSVDNSNEQVPSSAQSILEYYAKQGTPVILLLHIPISLPTMVQDVSAMWGRDICLGAPNLNPTTATTKFVDYLKSEQSPVVAILAGHIHMDHVDDVSPNNDTVQYTLGATYQGAARIFNIHG